MPIFAAEALRAVMAKLVVLRALLRIREHLIGLVDLLHALLRQIRQRVVVVVIRMVLPRQIAVSLFHLFISGGAGHAQHLIGITHDRCPPFV